MLDDGSVENALVPRVEGRGRVEKMEAAVRRDGAKESDDLVVVLWKAVTNNQQTLSSGESCAGTFPNWIEQSGGLLTANRGDD